MKKKICVFCSSSDIIDDIYFEVSGQLAEKIVEQNLTLVFGGSNVGLMKNLAENVKNRKGKIIGVMPQKIFDYNLACKIVDELIVTPDMYTRKAKLAEISDIFMALPGGFGTLEEISEVITHKQLGYHNKPIIIMNINGFYDNLLDFFETCFFEKFAKPDYRQLYFVANNVSEAFDYIKNYKPEESVNKWFKIS